MVGIARNLANSMRKVTTIGIVVLLIGASAAAQTLYKYRGEDGEWIYADRPPADEQQPEVRELTSRTADAKFEVRYSIDGPVVRIVAHNPYYAPVETTLDFTEIEGIEYPHPDEKLRWVVAPNTATLLLELALLETAQPPSIRYRYECHLLSVRVHLL